MRATYVFALILCIAATLVAMLFVFYGVAFVNPDLPLVVDWWFWLLAVLWHCLASFWRRRPSTAHG
jgi:hypothetical protein